MKIRVIYLYIFGFILMATSVSAQYSLNVGLSSNADVLVRGCSDKLIFTLMPAAEEDITLNVELGGTAVKGVDYNISLDTMLIFGKDDNEISYTIIPILTGPAGPEKNLHITISGDEIGADVFYDVKIVEEGNIAIEGVGDTILACRDIPIELSVSGNAGEYKWYPTDMVSDSIGNTTSLFPTEDMWFYVEGKIGSCTMYDSVYIDLIDPVVNLFTTSPTSFCESGVVALNANTNFPDRFSWNHPETLDDPTSLTPQATVSQSTLYIGTLSFYNCSISDSLYIKIDSLPDVNIISIPPTADNCDKYCKGDIIKMTDSELIIEENYPDIKYQWDEDYTILNNLDTLRSILAELYDTRTYYRTTTNGKCEVRDSILIEVIQTDLEIFPSDTLVCYTKPVKVTAFPKEGLTDITWEPEDDLSCTDCLEPTIRATRSTTYTVTAMKENCCPVEASIHISVRIPPIPIEPLYTCPGESVQIIVDYDSLGLKDPKWLTNQATLSCTDCFNPIATPLVPTTYTLQAYNDDGCLYQGTVRVNFYDEPQARIKVEPSLVVSIGSEVEVSLETEETLDSQVFTWTYNDFILNQNRSSAVVKIEKEGTENVITVHYVDNNGCKRGLSVVITGEKPDVRIPNAFTPDDVGNNDFFRPLFKQSPVPSDLIEEFVIVNRFGKIVYNNESANGWDGRIKGTRKAPPDVYMYRVKLLLPNGVVYKAKGDVTLIR